MNRKARVCVVGAGWWSARTHLPAIAKNTDAELIAICDANMTRAIESKEMFGAEFAFDDIEDALKIGLDCVLIATPHNQHFLPAMAALKAGVDVMIEKPMVLSPLEAWELVRVAAENNCNLHMGYTFPHSSHVQKARDLLLENSFGELEFGLGLFTGNILPLYRGDKDIQKEEGAPFSSQKDTYTSKKSGGGQLFTQTTHVVSTMLFLTDAIPTSISGFLNDSSEKVDSSNSLIMKTRNKFFATFGSSGAMTDHSNRFEEYKIMGRLGHVNLDTAKGTLETQVKSEKLLIHEPLSQELANPMSETSRVLISTFLKKASVIASGILGALTVEVLEAARLSSLEAKAIDINPPINSAGKFEPKLIKESNV
jgi:predicted dehydrogenase